MNPTAWPAAHRHSQDAAYTGGISKIAETDPCKCASAVTVHVLQSLHSPWWVFWACLILSGSGPTSLIPALAGNSTFCLMEKMNRQPLDICTRCTHLPTAESISAFPASPWVLAAWGLHAYPLPTLLQVMCACTGSHVSRRLRSRTILMISHIYSSTDFYKLSLNRQIVFKSLS